MGAVNREKILQASIHLFNEDGATAVSTNHIAQKAGVSPGNLYFHFENKEKIILELFKQMCAQIYEAWDPHKKLSPMELIESAFEVFWRYRFFHREMYPLRRKDPELSKAWKAHLARCLSLMQRNYVQWRRKGQLRKIETPADLRFLSDMLLMSSSSYLGFFESAEKPATRRTIRTGIEHVGRLMAPYL